MRGLDAAQVQQMAQQALTHPRRRSHLNWHEPATDTVQRFWVHMQAGTYVRPHCHCQQDRLETTVLVDGAADLLLFDEAGIVLARHALHPQGLRAIELQPHEWHSFYIPQSATLFEVKAGPYEPTQDKRFAEWAPAEGDANVPAFLQRLATAVPGDCLS